MKTQYSNKFFSLDAGEANPHNEWTKQFLADWVGLSRSAKNCYREMIILEKRCKTFYDLETAIDKLEVGQSLQLVRRRYQLLAFYQSRLPRNITYLENFYTAREEIKHITRIHERMHAFHHCNYLGECSDSNLRENLWTAFSSVSPVYKEFLAQLFTYKCLENTHLESYFKGLSTRQPSICQTWTLGKDLSKQEVFDLYISIKDKKWEMVFPELNHYAEWFKKYWLKDNDKPKNKELGTHIKQDLAEWERALIECMDEREKDPAFQKSVDDRRIDNVIDKTIRVTW